MQLLLAAQEGEWDEVAAVIHAFQQMTAAIKFCPRPVVVAPFGLTLGGGAEICLHAARRQPHAETYIGLVEAGVGLIPAGGGTKEMLLRAVDQAMALAPPDPKDPPSRFAQSAEIGDCAETGLRDDCDGEGFNVGCGGAWAGDAGAVGPHHNESRAAVAGREGAGGGAGRGEDMLRRQQRTQIPAPGMAALAMLETGV